MTQAGATLQPTVYVVDADSAVRDSLSELLTLNGYRVMVFGSAAEFLDGLPLAANACLVTEVHLPDMSGIELIERLRARGLGLPVIIIANHSDVPTVVRAIRSGAVDFLEKPFLDRALLQRTRELLARQSPSAASGQG